MYCPPKYTKWKTNREKEKQTQFDFICFVWTDTYTQFFFYQLNELNMNAKRMLNDEKYWTWIRMWCKGLISKDVMNWMVGNIDLLLFHLSPPAGAGWHFSIKCRHFQQFRLKCTEHFRRIPMTQWINHLWRISSWQLIYIP